MGRSRLHLVAIGDRGRGAGGAEGEGIAGIYPKTKEPKALYDRSWSGWGTRDDLPVEPKA
jgi:hypothetical protein